jgi:hypothetical protein
MSKLDEIRKQFDSKLEEAKERMKLDAERLVGKNKEAEQNLVIDKEDRNKIADSAINHLEKKGIKLRRKEKKMITNMEYDSVKSYQGMTIGLAVIGLVFLMLIRNFLPNDAMYTIIILVGSFMFIPVGMIMGWVMFDPVMRCKILRKMSKRNYGLVNFVGKGRKMVSKIKNFDYGLIWKEKECWVLTKDKIYQLTKDGNAANDGKEIDPDSVITLVDTVPVIFVDMDSMEPLSIIQKDRVAVFPGEIGPCLKAWMDNQKAKMLATKNAMNLFMIIAIVACIGAIVISFMTMGKVDELTKSLTTVQDQLNQIIQSSTIPKVTV